MGVNWSHNIGVHHLAQLGGRVDEVGLYICGRPAGHFEQLVEVLSVEPICEEVDVSQGERGAEAVGKVERGVSTQSGGVFDWEAADTLVEGGAGVIGGQDVGLPVHLQLGSVHKGGELHLHRGDLLQEGGSAELPDHAHLQVSAVLNSLEGPVPSSIHPEPNHVDLLDGCELKITLQLHPVGVRLKVEIDVIDCRLLSNVLDGSSEFAKRFESVQVEETALVGIITFSVLHVKKPFVIDRIRVFQGNKQLDISKFILVSL